MKFGSALIAACSVPLRPFGAAAEPVALAAPDEVLLDEQAASRPPLPSSAAPAPMPRSRSRRETGPVRGL